MSANLQPLFGMMIAVWIFYMAFEAYHTAKRRQLGQPVDEFSSIVPRSGQPLEIPAGADRFDRGGAALSSAQFEYSAHQRDPSLLASGFDLSGCVYALRAAFRASGAARSARTTAEGGHQ